MQAILYDTPDKLYFGDLPRPPVGPQQVLVRVRASGVNRADLLQRRGLYPPPAGESDILGLEVAGEVIALGQAVRHLQVGQRVCGLVSGGGYAEYCLLDSELALVIPDDWSFTYAAAIPEAFLTAHGSLYEAGQLQAGEAVLVQAGASGVGITALQLARQLKAQLYFTAGSREKIAGVERIVTGAQGINYTTHDFAQELLALTAQQGVDVIEDFIGAKYLTQHVQLLKQNGRLVIVGLLGGKTAELNLALLLQKRLQVKGTILRSLSLPEKRGLVQRFKKKWWQNLLNREIRPIIDTIFPVEDVEQAHQHMLARQNLGKIVLQWD